MDFFDGLLTLLNKCLLTSSSTNLPRFVDAVNCMQLLRNIILKTDVGRYTNSEATINSFNAFMSKTFREPHSGAGLVLEFVETLPKVATYILDLISVDNYAAVESCTIITDYLLSNGQDQLAMQCISTNAEKIKRGSVFVDDDCELVSESDCNQFYEILSTLLHKVCRFTHTAYKRH